MGQYCSYCNQKLPSALAVEHVQPKSLHPDLELHWSNLLLSCASCNSRKGSNQVNINDYLWPDEHNTHLAFDYLEDGRIEPKAELPASVKRKAQNLLDLVGLQKYANIEGVASDRRWFNRKDVISKSKEALYIFKKCARDNNAEEAATLISMWATDAGFFSVWLHTFKNEQVVRKALIERFVGTAKNAFDEDGQPIKRHQDSL